VVTSSSIKPSVCPGAALNLPIRSLFKHGAPSGTISHKPS
jgi:hypothetical protein